MIVILRGLSCGIKVTHFPAGLSILAALIVRLFGLQLTIQPIAGFAAMGI